jgi:hypothetical protein
MSLAYLQVSVDNLQVMQGFQPSRRLYENFPDVILINQLIALLMVLDQLKYVSSIRIFHYNANRN